MKTILTKLPADKARDELKKFTLFAVGFSGVSLFAFWFLGVAGLALGARALLLTWHKGNQGRAGRIWYRLGSGLAVAAGRSRSWWSSEGVSGGEGSESGDEWGIKRRSDIQWGRG